MKVSKGGRNITNLRFADDINALAEEEELELEALVESLDKTCARYTWRSVLRRPNCLMTNRANGIQSER